MLLLNHHKHEKNNYSLWKTGNVTLTKNNMKKRSNLVSTPILRREKPMIIFKRGKNLKRKNLYDYQVLENQNQESLV